MMYIDFFLSPLFSSLTLSFQFFVGFHSFAFALFGAIGSGSGSGFGGQQK